MTTNREKKEEREPKLATEMPREGERKRAGKSAKVE